MRLDVNDIKLAYQQKVVISNLTFSLESGDFLAVFGKNGAGKSSLIKSIVGEVPLAEGSILIDDVDIKNFKNWKNIGYVSQKFDNFSFQFPLTINELLFASNTKKTPNYEVNQILERLNLFDIANENINSLSGGQLQRVFLARALVNKPKLLIMDEPFVGIDTESSNSLKSLLTELSEAGTTIVLISHNPLECKKLFSHVLILNTNFSYEFKTYDVFLTSGEGGEENDL